MTDPHNREYLITHGWLNATQVINHCVPGFTETPPGKHAINQIEYIDNNTNFYIFLRELPSLPCIFSHCNAIGNVLSQDIQYHS
jgi:hypothetical protein